MHDITNNIKAQKSWASEHKDDIIDTILIAMTLALVLGIFMVSAGIL